MKIGRSVLLSLAFAALSGLGQAGVEPQGLAFSYQGRLTLSGEPVNGTRAMVFRLFDADSGGAQHGELAMPVEVEAGLFVVELDYGDGVFLGQQLWLEVEVEGQLLVPRQRIASAPYALYALDGPAGPGTTAYAYIYALDSQVVFIEGDVNFSSNGPLAGITHVAGQSAVTFNESGLYDIEFSVSGTESNQFALVLNGVVMPGTTYGSGAGTQQNSGSVIASVAAGDVLTLRNHSSAAAVTLQSQVGGTEANVVASIRIRKLD